uniref:Uncharacterized protein n=1 Tax=Nelumbo nucifera TaxID=4432 RepID=A0A822Z0H1_NELNU|nr:TPA_asm: hypothetical protein HUJ06_014197 [Nelumbo nucifera]
MPGDFSNKKDLSRNPSNCRNCRIQAKPYFSRGRERSNVEGFAVAATVAVMKQGQEGERTKGVGGRMKGTKREREGGSPSPVVVVAYGDYAERERE